MYLYISIKYLICKSEILVPNTNLEGKINSVFQLSITLGKCFIAASGYLQNYIHSWAVFAHVLLLLHS